MCGILGLIRTAVTAPWPTRTEFEVACRTLIHRGPDEHGIYHDQKVWLGHRRLSIIDLGNGQQPIHNENQSVWTVFNGEIYNFLELRQILKNQGHCFYTDSDSEVIVHAYEEWGSQCFAKFRGMFAIALWDKKQQTLLLARDPLGKKPLYLTRQKGILAFASEIKALQVLPGLNFTINQKACRDFMLFGYIPTPHSIYSEVQKLEPGYVLRLKNNEVRSEAFWDFSMEPKLTGSENQLVNELEALLSDAVKLRLRSDVPFGVFLSGGLDSSIVAALMARHLEQPVKTFSIGFNEDVYNELDDAQLIAKHIGSDHYSHIVEADAIQLLERLVWHFDEPFADSSAIPTFLVSQMAVRHVKMVLSGDGGDEAFGGYDRYLKYRLIEKFHNTLGRRGALTIRQLGQYLGGTFGHKLAWLGDRIALPFPDRYISGVALSTPMYAESVLKNKYFTKGYGIAESKFRNGYADNIDEMVHGDIRSYLLDDILVKVDRTTMANSLEARAPLLDQELISWATRLPNHFKMHHGKGKYLLRRLAARLLPAEALKKQKKGFAIPLKEWFRGELREMTWDLISSRDFKERGIFNPEVVTRSMEEHQQGVHDHSEHLWQFMVFELWAREFMDRSPNEWKVSHDYNLQASA